MNEDLNIYDGRTIEGSSEAKSRSTWVEMFDMIDLAINNLQQQNKDLKRQVNELNSKLNKVAKFSKFSKFYISKLYELLMSRSRSMREKRRRQRGT